MKPDVLVVVEGGLARVSVLTPGLRVELRDYDIDGAEPDYLHRDAYGDDCAAYVEQFGESDCEYQPLNPPAEA